MSPVCLDLAVLGVRPQSRELNQTVLSGCNVSANFSIRCRISATKRLASPSCQTDDDIIGVAHDYELHPGHGACAIGSPRDRRRNGGRY